VSGQDPILVTGANGHLGQALIVASSGTRPVRALVRSERAAAVLRELAAACQPEIHQVAYDDPISISRAGRGCAGWVNLVGILKQTRSARYEDAHQATARALVEAAKKAGATRIVQLSILGAEPGAANACLASKGRGDAILLEGPVPATILRLPMVLGPGELAAFGLGAKARAKRAALVRGGASLEQPIDTQDVVRAIQLALEEPSDEDLALDLAGPETLTHRELVTRVARALGTQPRFVSIPFGLVSGAAHLAERLMANPPITAAMLGVLEHDDCIDPEPACRRLGLELTPLEETLARTFAATAKDGGSA